MTHTFGTTQRLIRSTTDFPRYIWPIILLLFFIFFFTKKRVGLCIFCLCSLELSMLRKIFVTIGPNLTIYAISFLVKFTPSQTSIPRINTGNKLVKIRVLASFSNISTCEYSIDESVESITQNKTIKYEMRSFVAFYFHF